MGTRARINVVEAGQTIVSIYRQYDGYPEGLGKEVAEFLSGLTLVNGLGSEPKAVANGMGCLAAQLIGHLKTQAGNVYIRPTTPESHGEEYVYTVYERNGKLNLRARGGSMTAFGLPGDSESEMMTLYDGPASVYSPLSFEDAESALVEARDKAKRRQKA